MAFIGYGCKKRGAVAEKKNFYDIHIPITYSVNLKNEPFNYQLAYTYLLIFIDFKILEIMFKVKVIL